NRALIDEYKLADEMLEKALWEVDAVMHDNDANSDLFLVKYNRVQEAKGALQVALTNLYISERLTASDELQDELYAATTKKNKTREELLKKIEKAMEEWRGEVFFPPSKSAFRK